MLRLSPDAFWRMTPRELAAVLRLLNGPAPALARDAFERLRARFPDLPSSANPNGNPHG